MKKLNKLRQFVLHKPLKKIILVIFINIFYLAAGAAIIRVDYITKTVVVNVIKNIEKERHLPNESLRITSFFNFVSVENKGVSFGALQNLPNGSQILLTLTISITAIFFVYFYFVKQRLAKLGIFLIVCGAIGNIIDRIEFGYVRDFLDFHIYSYHWPAFNLADFFVSSGVILFVLSDVLQQIKDRDKGLVLLVDENDNPIGHEDKVVAHQNGLLHRAFSVFVLRLKDGNTEFLLQKRADGKYHSGGLFSNFCCSHFSKDLTGKSMLIAVTTRCNEENGIKIDLDNLCFVDKFTYKAKVGSSMTENEVDYIFTFNTNTDFPLNNFNEQETSGLEWFSLKQLQKDLIKNSQLYTPWLTQIMQNQELVSKILSSGKP